MPTKKRWMKEDSIKDQRESGGRGGNSKGVTSRDSRMIVSRRGSSKQCKMAQGATSHWDLKSRLWDLMTLKYKIWEKVKKNIWGLEGK